MNEQSLPSEPTADIDVQQLVAALPDEFGEFSGLDVWLREEINAKFDSRYAFDQELLQIAFTCHVNALMTFRNLDRAEAIRQACAFVEQAVREERAALERRS